ncbi:aldehyde oxidase [Anaeramoeba ignava]|uniref:Aldehyde oxidase n=1 Tax=Anaeramoeba ignava TaxID=1746090 RepID=A0A9Q0LHW5_ANAIG|nr:aldehyde oxidase [Anaeramoeba ignava]
MLKAIPFKVQKKHILTSTRLPIIRAFSQGLKLEKEYEKNQTFYLNGKKVIIDKESADPTKTLLDYLREKGLTGTKYGCGEGGCGACTVMISYYDSQENQIKNRAVNSCLVPLPFVNQMSVTTVEGLGTTKNLHPVQERIAKFHGSQCGFCTPGFVMSLQSTIQSHITEKNGQLPTKKLLENSFDGNLCRCTGYRPILDAAKSFGIDFDIKDSPVPFDKMKKFDPKKHLIEFPEELKQKPKPFVSKSEKHTWYQPTELKDLLNIKAEYPEAKIIVGNSEVGVETRMKNLEYKVSISTSKIPELRQFSELEKGIRIGASLPITDIMDKLEMIIKQKKGEKFKTQGLKEMIKIFDIFASRQIRNTACLGGNIATASPLSEGNPLLIALNAKFGLINTKGKKREVFAKDFFLKKYRQVDIKPNEILVYIDVPFTKKNEIFRAFKQSRRKEEDICIVNGMFRMEVDPNTNKIKDSCFAYGGVAPYTVHAEKTSEEINGMVFNRNAIDKIINKISNEITIRDNSPGGMVDYRRALIKTLFYKFALSVLYEMDPKSVSKGELSTIIEEEKPEMNAKQKFDIMEDMFPITEPQVHKSAELQTTGEAQYTADFAVPNCLHAAFVTSIKPHAKILSINSSQAEQIPGFVSFVSAKDIPKQGFNGIGTVFPDEEEVFATKEVNCVGAILGLVVAETPEIARKAARKISVEYQDLPTTLSIDEAIEKESFYPWCHKINRGNIEDGFLKSDFVDEGEITSGGQDHFYLETHAAIAIPKEEDEIEVISSTQNPAHTQHNISVVLGIPSHKIVSRVKRLGGGFGGKESRACLFATCIAVAAKKLNRPVRFSFERPEDMQISGGRHPFKAKFKVGYTKDGKIQAIDTQLFASMGHSLDLSSAIADRALFHSDSAYFIPNMRVVAKLCKTDLPSNTAFRGFGGPQGIFATETIMDLVARKLKKHPEEIREINLIKDGQKTIFGQDVNDCKAIECWKYITKSKDFLEQKRKEINLFNANNKYKKRGYAIMPLKFGISFTASFLNQAGALVHIYKDGSVLVSHCGIEMGQGVYTKITQVAAKELGVPVEKVFVNETCTSRVPNGSATAASTGADLNGFAVAKACQTLRKRLQPYFDKNPKLKFEEIAHKAYFDQVSLSTTGFYATPDIGYDFEKGKGRAFHYFTYGAAMTEVEIDTLTGGHEIIRTDIITDVGRSLNSAIDIGQVEGAFIQGAGWLTMEEVVIGDKNPNNKWIKDGFIFSIGPGNYKIPSPTDIPRTFNVTLLSNSSCPSNVHSSKAVGEPPFILGNSVFFAIKNAIYAARSENGFNEYFRLDAPSTCAKIKMACADKFTN